MRKYLILIIISIFGFIVSCSEKTEDEKVEELLTQAISKARINELNGFYFVGNQSGIPSLYWYDYNKDKVKIFWRDPDERVIDLLISPDNKAGFFITKRKQRLKSSQPAIEKGRLYRIDFEQKKTELITQLTDGIQIIPFWLDNDRFTLVINSVDLKIASYINKNTQVYNRFGKLLSDNTEVFDITKDGYPVTKISKLQLTSPNEMFTVIEKNDSVQIKQTKSRKEIKTRFVNKTILQINWAEDNKHVLLLMKTKAKKDDVNQDNENILLALFDLQKKKTVKMYSGIGVQNFRVIGNYLFFDSGVGKKSEIEIVNINDVGKIQKIKVNGGCSLRRI